ncbi:MAG: coproporphyrinogen III oxidase family protein [Propionibacterium sp.]|nr:coproporphyrinogen III oxidase family protein [Propionibacterium sp.]
MTAPTTTLPTWLADPYRSYTYGYPHKTAYRHFAEPKPLADLWAGEPTTNLFGYLHLPFCEMRCGFCNLFTTANPADDLVEQYLGALQREAETLRTVLPGARAVRLAVGGGTPTYLTVPQLERAFAALATAVGATPDEAVTSVETSPATATGDRMAYLRGIGVERVSIGVQSMVIDEVHGVGRPQQQRQVLDALDTIREVGPPRLNVDLMYGLAGQDAASWLESLRRVGRWAPDEVFIYPLYVRPLTGIGRRGRSWDDERRELYRIARDYLIDAGYEQSSMRRFHLPGQAGADDEYTCQRDGMVGLGCGARSYTSAVHYSREFAVGRTGVKEIIADYVATERFDVATHGFVLSAEERMRRWVLQSLLHTDGLDPAQVRAHTGLNPVTELPRLAELVDLGLAEWSAQRLRLTAAGMELSDAIGPALYSGRVHELSAGHELR